MTRTIAGLSTRALLVLTLLVIEDDTTMLLINPGSWSTLLIILHNTLDRFFPSAHLFQIGLLSPFGGLECLEEAAVLSDETDVGNTLEDTVKFLRSATRHYIHNVAVVHKKVVEDIDRTLLLSAYSTQSFRYSYLGTCQNDIGWGSPRSQRALIIHNEQSSLGVSIHAANIID
jgi:hypothetical protein